MNKFLSGLFLGLLSFSAVAQFRVEVSGVGLTQIPVAVASFRGDDAAPQKIGSIVRADLERSGQFRIVEAGNAPIDELARPDVSLWRQNGADGRLCHRRRRRISRCARIRYAELHHWL